MSNSPPSNRFTPWVRSHQEMVRRFPGAAGHRGNREPESKGDRYTSLSLCRAAGSLLLSGEQQPTAQQRASPSTVEQVG